VSNINRRNNDSSCTFGSYQHFVWMCNSSINFVVGNHGESARHFSWRAAELFWVPSPSVFYDTGRISRLAVDPSNVNSSLLRLLQSSRDTPVVLVVSGASSTLARHEIIAALSQVKGDMSKLELSFFGDVSDASEVQRAVERRGGKYAAAK
jgi:hypothetical protein